MRARCCAGILDDIIPIAKRAVDRLSVKLEGLRGTGTEIDLEEEFRLLTLQVRSSWLPCARCGNESMLVQGAGCADAASVHASAAALSGLRMSAHMSWL